MAPQRRAGRVFVGTSGWVYPEWVGTVYPRKVTTAQAFACYARHFQTVELNATFYHFPRETTVDKWTGLGGPRFTWSVKAWRWLTHLKRLQGVATDLRDFLSRVAPLVSGGVVLFQLPPSFRQDLARLERFVRLLPRTVRSAVEFRHNSWFAPETYRLLTAHRVALVGVDAPGITRVLDVRTAPFAYFRLHGASRWYQHDYTRRELGEFAAAARAHLRQGDLFVYFDNTADGHAFRNALTFRELMARRARHHAAERAPCRVSPERPSR